MTGYFRWVAVLAAAALAACLSGCGASGPPNCDVSGTVTVNGKALDDGEITFADEDIKIPSATVPVKGGAFSLVAKAGKKKVRIYMKQVVAGSNMSTEGLPGRYNADTELTATIKPKEDNKQAFTLTVP